VNIKTDELNKLLLATHNKRRMAFHLAAVFRELVVFQGKMNCAKENIKTDELDKLLLATDNKGRTVFHLTALFHELKLFQGMVNLAKENLTKGEVNKLLLPTDNDNPRSERPQTYSVLFCQCVMGGNQKTLELGQCLTVVIMFNTYCALLSHTANCCGRYNLI
jgi:hypothetical protein